MDARLYAEMLSDERIVDFKRLGHKYSQERLHEFIELLKDTAYRATPLVDTEGNPLYILEETIKVKMKSLRRLLVAHDAPERYGLNAMEEEISSSMRIENISSSRESVRSIMQGAAPRDGEESRIYGMKKGLDFISDPQNKITEENIRRLYQTTIGDFLEESERLGAGVFYRQAPVYVTSLNGIVHEGMSWEKLPGAMARLIIFAGAEDDMNDLIKASLIHFYIGYIHPWFDGNGRMARMIHLWYLVQKGYSSALFIPFSRFIEQSRKSYYNAYKLAEANRAITGTLDATVFAVYFAERVYNQLTDEGADNVNDAEFFRTFLTSGGVTEKERKLWNFTLSAYGTSEFSTKMLERDFRNAAYATVRNFVMKFRAAGLLEVRHYGKNRNKYRAAAR